MHFAVRQSREPSSKWALKISSCCFTSGRRFVLRSSAICLRNCCSADGGAGAPSLFSVTCLVLEERAGAGDRAERRGDREERRYDRAERGDRAGGDWAGCRGDCTGTK